MLPKDTTYRFRHRVAATGEIKEWSTPVVELKTRHYCESCNNEWGSTLETAMRDAAADLILEEPKRIITSNHCKAMADFAFKTTVLANHMNMLNGVPFFSDQQRRAFALNRTIPSGIQVFLAEHGTPYVTGMFRSVYGLGNRTKPQLSFELYTCTFSIGFLVLQLLAAKWTDKIMRNILPPPFVRQPEVLDNDAVRRIFPELPMIKWPPATVLGDESMEDWFWQRFGNLEVPSDWLR